ncbi:zinc-ribbon domain-containing protein [Arthrobacter sp. 135MFCol5.1]|uniref:zinc-ribbon domain-containing protein n=1 Tax=Arthrobacter sp. 135MFCol5.1 TaxID=1158050 RepID=UPI0018C9C7A1|nr:zinc-ribbon domain-containing protein [Arthrobacter sp. 135MFCol5.1]
MTSTEASARIYATGASPQLVMDAMRGAASAIHHRWKGIPTADTLQTAAAILESVLDPDVVRAVSNYGRPYRDAYILLTERMAEAGNPSGYPAVDQAWLMLRWTAAAARNRWVGQQLTDDPTPLIEPIRPASQLTEAIAPFNSYLACVQTSDRTDLLWWKDHYFHQTASGPLCMCPEGHVQHLRASDGTRRMTRIPRCAICTGRKVMPGVNTPADKAPRLIAEWDYEADQTYTPWNVCAGSGRTGHWICPNGHRYDAKFGNRVGRESGCPLCAGTRRIPGLNDLATTHPDLAKMWDSEAGNTRTCSELSAGSEARVGWKCTEGHAFVRTPLKLVRTQGQCPVCKGTLLIPGVNDLATLKPEVAAQWNVERNGLLRPSLFHPRSGVKVWWICPEGHEFQMAIAFRSMARNITCPIDTGRRFLQGTNDLATKEPQLATDWDGELNGATASDVLAGGNAKRWWTCPAGHTQHQTVNSRRKARGCAKCPSGDRAASSRKD